MAASSAKQNTEGQALYRGHYSLQGFVQERGAPTMHLVPSSNALLQISDPSWVVVSMIATEHYNLYL